MNCECQWKTRARLLIELGLVAGLLITGCRSFTPPVTYYTLTGIFASGSDKKTDGSQSAFSSVSPFIAIRSVNIPGYVNRLQMVTRSDQNQVRVSEKNRWADYPDRMMKRVVGENIQALIPGSHVSGAPWPAAIRPDVTLSIDVLEWVGTDKGEVQLSANWTITTKASPDTVEARQTILAEPVSGRGFDDLAAAHSRAVQKLCHQVADAIVASLSETQ